MRDRKVELHSAFLSDNPFTHSGIKRYLLACLDLSAAPLSLAFYDSVAM